MIVHDFLIGKGWDARGISSTKMRAEPQQVTAVQEVSMFT